MSIQTEPTWYAKRTDDSRLVEEMLHREGFLTVDAYRFNSASIRVRITDERFRGKSHEKRDDMVEPALDKLPRDIQGDIMNLLLLYPGEEKDSFRAFITNQEFENGETDFD